MKKPQQACEHSSDACLDYRVSIMSSDGDDSLASSEVEAYDSDAEYVVEKVLSERTTEGIPYYLVKWDGYPVEASTWEPTEYFNDPEILRTWKKRSEEEARGLQPCFDVPGWEARNAQLQKQKEARQRKRRIERQMRAKRRGTASRDDYSDSSEAAEVNLHPDDAMGIKTKPKMTQHKSFKPPTTRGKYLGTSRPPTKAVSRNIQSEESSSESDSSDMFVSEKSSKNIEKPNAVQAICEKRGQRQSTASEERGQPNARTVVEPRPKAASTSGTQMARRSSASSAEIPLIALRRAPEPLLMTSRSSSSSSSNKLPLATVHARKLATTRRGGPSSRGGATRGGLSVGPKNVFAPREVPPKKKKPGLIETSKDPKNAPKHYSNMHLQYKAQTQAKELSERAPNLEAIGGLYDPTNPLKLKPIRPTIQRDSTLLGPSELRSPNIIPAATDFPQPLLRAVHHGPRPDYRIRDGQNAICAYFYENGFCSNEHCKLQHSDREDLPIAPKPGEGPCRHFVEGKCVRGDKCPWNHPEGVTRDTPFKSTARKWNETSATNMPSQDNISTFTSNIRRMPTPNIRPPWRSDKRSAAEIAFNVRPPWRTDDPSNGVCFFWHTRDSCKNGTKCQWQHSYEGSIPMVPPPTNWKWFGRPIPDPPPNWVPPLNWRRDFENYLPIAGLEIADSTATSTIIPEASLANVRHPWKRDNPPPNWRREFESLYKAVCFEWHKTGNCTKGINCYFHHSHEGGLPIASDPGEASSDFESDEGRRGQNLMGNMQNDQKTSDEESFSLPPEAPAGPTLSRANLPPKSVAFAIGEQQPLIMETPTAAKYARSHVKELCHSWAMGSCDDEHCPFSHYYDGYPPICNFWRWNSCNYGDSCRKYHPPKNLPVLEAKSSMLDQNSDLLQASTSTLQGSRNINGKPPPQFTDQIVRSPTSLLPTSDHPLAQALSIVTSADVSATNVPKRKMTVEDYRQSKAINPVAFNTPAMNAPNQNITAEKYNQGNGARAMTAHFGPAQSEHIILDFGEINEGELNKPWGSSFSNLTGVHFEQQCTAQGFQAQYRNILQRIYWRGKLSADAASSTLFDKLTKQLRLQIGGLISVCDELVVLIYPGIPEWKFLADAPNSQMNYIIFQPQHPLNRHVKQSLDLVDPAITTYQRQLVASIYKLSFSRLLPVPNDKDKTYHFYLLFPPENVTADFLASWIRASRPWKSKLYNCKTAGAWDFFVNSSKVKSGILLIHKSLISTVGQLPSFMNLILERSSKKVTIWYINDTLDINPLFPVPLLATPGGVSATRLFPCGGAYFLTPSFLVAEPEKALELLKWFQRRFVSAPPGMYRIVCACGIQDYLLDLALDKAKERENFLEKYDRVPTKDAMEEELGLTYVNCNRRFACHTVFSEILAVAEYCPIVQAPEYIDADDEQKLVSWFAWWAIRKLHKYRRLTVVGTSCESIKKASRMTSVIPTRRPPISYLYDESADMDTSSDDHRVNDQMEVDEVSEIIAQNRAIIKNRSPQFTNATAGIEHPYPFVPQQFQNLLDTQQFQSLIADTSPRFNGPSDLRPLSSGSGASSRSGIATDKCGHHFVPRSVHPSGSVGPEIGTKAGYISSEDKEVYRHPHSQDSPRHGSIQSGTVGFGLQNKEHGVGNQVDSEMGDATGHKMMEKKVTFEATTVWYERLKAEGKLEGGGWEHIYIGDYIRCFKVIGVTAT